MGRSGAAAMTWAKEHPSSTFKGRKWLKGMRQGRPKPARKNLTQLSDKTTMMTQMTMAIAEVPRRRLGKRQMEDDKRCAIESQSIGVASDDAGLASRMNALDPHASWAHQMPIQIL
jgi:hypothetical protein